MQFKNYFYIKNWFKLCNLKDTYELYNSNNIFRLYKFTSQKINLISFFM